MSRDDKITYLMALVEHLVTGDVHGWSIMQRADEVYLTAFLEEVTESAYLLCYSMDIRDGGEGFSRAEFREWIEEQAEAVPKG